jgi:hypothetical protein
MSKYKTTRDASDIRVFEAMNNNLTKDQLSKVMKMSAERRRDFASRYYQKLTERTT